MVVEQAFAFRDERAFPHVNFYVPDAALGVRLEPSATMGFKFRDNPRTTIHVNAQGYRGSDWPALTETDDEIVVLGDSQVFGLGVDDDETFSALLANHTGRPVLNAGIPTYGPPEYYALAEEVLEQRHPTTVVVVLNFLNDPFELGRPNRDRHAVWDGWAVRAENAPGWTLAFPGRRWLMSQSHAMFALRRWIYFRDRDLGPEALDLGTPSEGNFEDLVAGELGVLPGDAAGVDEARTRVQAVERELRHARDELDEVLFESSDRYDRSDADKLARRPGDIVDDEAAESGRSVVLTAALIRESARARQLALESAERGERRGQARALVANEDALVAERAALRVDLVARMAGRGSIFEAYIAALAVLCKAHGAELIVVALPVDVQVDPAEWDKYGVTGRPDMSESLVLLDELVATAERLGLEGLNLTQALRGAEPGAFLNGDIHMTAKGHAAVAEALAALFEEPAKKSKAATKSVNRPKKREP